MQTHKPLDIINKILLDGMKVVGELFGSGQMQLPFVLQSAETMKAAVRHLEPHMDKVKGSEKGTMVIATVRGDVHDIGKNLVDIILSNNGYRVVNLGIKIAPQAIIEAVREHEPDIVGLSGLLVKSAQMMVITAEEMSHRGVVPDLLVGGAALTPNFTRKRIAPAYDGRVLYARDAMDGLALANALLDPKRREETLEERAPIGATEGSVSDNKKQRTRPVRAAELPAPLDRIPQPPDSDRHILRDIPLDEIWPWINPKMLFNRHLGFQGDFNAKLKSGDPQAEKIASCLEELRSDARTGRLTGQAVWRWFEAETESDDLLLFEAGGAEPLVRWTLPRRPGGLPGIPGYIQSAQAGGRDWLALFVVSASGPVRAWAEELKENGAYLKSHSLLALALEAAEGLAEWLHARLRGQWGFPDSPDLGMNERFKARYQGIRYSPGYPACPDLALQDGFWKALQPQDIGVSLTEGHMMEPEASVSAMVLHHPEAKYFAAE